MSIIAVLKVCLVGSTLSYSVSPSIAGSNMSYGRNVTYEAVEVSENLIVLDRPLSEKSTPAYESPGEVSPRMRNVENIYSAIGISETFVHGRVEDCMVVAVIDCTLSGVNWPTKESPTAVASTVIPIDVWSSVATILAR